MKRLLILLFGLLFLASCRHCPVLDSAVDETTQTTVGLKLVSQRGTEVIVSFSGDPDFTHIVQEIQLDSGEVLIECFRNNATLIFDTHSWIVRPHHRVMKVYAANVHGCDEDNGFGHLPDNGAGVKTTISKNFNASYQKTHETRGRIVYRSPASFLWSITDNGTSVKVTIPVGE